MSVPRPKPWEVSSGTSAASVAPDSTASAAAPNTIALPDRPTSLNDMSSTPGAAAASSTSPLGSSTYGTSAMGTGYGGSGYGNTGYGSSMYGSGYGSSMYGSGFGSSMYGGGYSGFGSSMYGGGYGGLGGSMYGGYGGYGGGYGGYGMMNQGMGPGGGILGEGTQATFHLIESIIGAVGGFAQMLEATYMATHSSFFTMVSLAEQFGNLKNALGSLLGIFALITFIKKIFYKLTGQNFNNGLNMKEFAKFEKTQKKLEDNVKKQQLGRGSKLALKPLLLFLAAAIGFPYLLSKAIQKLNQQQMEQRRRQEQLQANGGINMPGAPQQGALSLIDPNTIEFAKALYEFNPENPNVEIELKPNELVAILSKCDPVGNESKWWKVRSRLGKVGYVPSNYLSLIERKVKAIEPSQANTQANPSAQPALLSDLPTNNLKADKMVQDFHKSF